MNHGLNNRRRTRVSTLLTYYASVAEVLAAVDIILQHANEYKCIVHALAPNWCGENCDSYETCGECIKGLVYSTVQDGDFDVITTGAAHDYLYEGRTINYATKNADPATNAGPDSGTSQKG